MLYIIFPNVEGRPSGDSSSDRFEAIVYWLISHQTRPNENYEVPHLCWKMLHGVSLLYFRKRSYLAELGYDWFGDEKDLENATVDALSPEGVTQYKYLVDDFNELFRRFDIDKLSEQAQNIYENARDYVLHHYRCYYAGVSKKVLRRFVGAIALRCDPGYRGLLESHDPLSMAIYARMLVMLSGLDYAWWIHGQGDYEVLSRDIHGIRNRMPDRLRWSMDWPCRVLSGEVILVRTTPIVS
jgi:hypothetical protein